MNLLGQFFLMLFVYAAAIVQVTLHLVMILISFTLSILITLWLPIFVIGSFILILS